MRMNLIAIPILAILCGCAEPNSNATGPPKTKAEVANAYDESTATLATSAPDTQVTKMQEAFVGTTWKTATSSDPKFSIEFPGDFADKTIDTAVKIRMLIHTEKQGSGLDGGQKFSLFVVSFPESKRPRSSHEAFEVFSKGMTRRTEPIEVKCGSHSGFQISVANTQTIAIARIFLIEDLVYQLMIETPVGEQEPGAQVQNRFFESLVPHAK